MERDCEQARRAISKDGKEICGEKNRTENRSLRDIRGAGGGTDRGMAGDLQELIGNLVGEWEENRKESLRKGRVDFVGDAPVCERSGYLRMKGALNLPF